MVGVLADDIRKMPRRAPRFHPALRSSAQLSLGQRILQPPWLLANRAGTVLETCLGWRSRSGTAHWGLSAWLVHARLVHARWAS